MFLNPFTTMLSTIDSFTALYKLSEIPAVPGHFGFKWLPAGENGSTGATSAFPNLRAIAGAVTRAMMLCPPRTACGPRCSVPPL